MALSRSIVYHTAVEYTQLSGERGRAYLRMHDSKILLRGDLSLRPGLRRVRSSELGLDRLLVLFGRLQLRLLLCDDRVLLLGVLTRDLEQLLALPDGSEARSSILTGSDDVSLECRDPRLEGALDNLRRVWVSMLAERGGLMLTSE